MVVYDPFTEGQLASLGLADHFYGNVNTTRLSNKYQLCLILTLSNILISNSVRECTICYSVKQRSLFLRVKVVGERVLYPALLTGVPRLYENAAPEDPMGVF